MRFVERLASFSAIRVPTLVVYRARRRAAALGVAELVPGAQAVQIPGDDLGGVGQR